MSHDPAPFESRLYRMSTAAWWIAVGFLVGCVFSIAVMSL